MKNFLKKLDLVVTALVMVTFSTSCSSPDAVDKKLSASSSAFSGTVASMPSASTSPYQTMSTSSRRRDTVSDSSTTVQTFPPIEDPTPKELSSEYDQFMEVINRLDTVKTSFTKLDLSSTKMLSDGRTKEYVLSSSNTSLISQWIDLLTDMKVTAIPYACVSGNGYVLHFYSLGEKIKVGGIVGRYIYLPISHGRKVTMYIDNYDELRPRFLELEKEMGFPAAE